MTSGTEPSRKYPVRTNLRIVLWLLYRRAIRKPVKEPVCAKCKYPIKGLSSDQCPECGANLSIDGVVEYGAKVKWISTVLLYVSWTIAFVFFASAVFPIIDTNLRYEYGAQDYVVLSYGGWVAPGPHQYLTVAAITDPFDGFPDAILRSPKPIKYFALYTGGDSAVGIQPEVMIIRASDGRYKFTKQSSNSAGLFQQTGRAITNDGWSADPIPMGTLLEWVKSRKYDVSVRRNDLMVNAIEKSITSGNAIYPHQLRKEVLAQGSTQDFGYMRGPATLPGIPSGWNELIAPTYLIICITLWTLWMRRLHRWFRREVSSPP